MIVATNKASRAGIRRLRHARLEVRMRFIKSGRVFDFEDFMGRRLFAHLATATPSGPRDTPVWFLWDEGCVWIISVNSDDTFPEKIRRHPICAVGIVDFRPDTGLVQHVGIRGEGALLPFRNERAQRLLSKYLGPNMAAWDERFQRSLRTAHGVMVRIMPLTVVLRDQSFSVGPAAKFD
jgi:hypothetical protein